MFQDVRARRSRAGLSLTPACHCASSGRHCPQSPWWAAPAAGTRDQQRHAREAQAPGRPQRAHGECQLWARATRRGWAHPGWSPGGTPAGPSMSPWATSRWEKLGQTVAGSGPGALAPGPFQMALLGAWCNPEDDQSRVGKGFWSSMQVRLLLPHLLLVLAPSGAACIPG